MWVSAHGIFFVDARKMKLDHVCEAGARSSWDICHGEELNPVLKEATWILSRVDDESPQAALARLVPQSQQRFSLRHVEADIQHLHHPQVKQSACNDAAVPGAGEAECRAVNADTVNIKWWIRGQDVYNAFKTSIVCLLLYKFITTVINSGVWFHGNFPK